MFKARVSVRLSVDEGAIKTLKTDPQIVEYIRRGAERFAGELRAATPHHSGAGAASIRAHDSRAQGATDVGWDKEHWYLIFPEYGTKLGARPQPPQAFVRKLLDRYTYD